MSTEKRPFLPMKVAPHTPNRIDTPCGSISVVWYNNEYEDPYIKAEEAAAFVALAGNAHDDLVAALRLARTDIMAAKTFSELCHDSPLSLLDHMQEGLPSMKATLSKIDSALSKAWGE
jgi:hypothetical protein